ncbi:hypothetical protein D7Y41_17670 [Anaerotruncus sp. 1XD22-93]|nr:hypothetical protein D7Y41_17670 [Anaerotruncus sp. 1XD22-93]
MLRPLCPQIPPSGGSWLQKNQNYFYCTTVCPGIATNTGEEFFNRQMPAFLPRRQGKKCKNSSLLSLRYQEKSAIIKT